MLAELIFRVSTHNNLSRTHRVCSPQKGADQRQNLGVQDRYICGSLKRGFDQAESPVYPTKRPNGSCRVATEKTTIARDIHHLRGPIPHRHFEWVFSEAMIELVLRTWTGIASVRQPSLQECAQNASSVFSRT